MQIEDSFLLDEVRYGFMIPAAIKQAWAAQLEVLAEIDRVCKKHKIQYFADWGTLLGVVRHGGFIPWDDDLDIVMKRDDYQKFMAVARFDMAEGFDVQTFRNQEDCWLFMGKVVGRNRFFFEKEHLRKFHNFPYIASVDIFVLDYVYRDSEKEEKRRNLCKYMLGVADGIVEGIFSPREREHGLKTAEEMYGKRLRRIEDPVEMGRYLYGTVEKIFAEVPECEADSLTQLFPWGMQGNSFQFPKKYYEQSIVLPFECVSMPVPLLYDRMLRKRYGDYMRLVKKAGAHEYPFFEGQKKNLQAVLDFALPEFQVDKAKLCRSEEECICEKLSYKAMVRECMTELQGMKNSLSREIDRLLNANEEVCRELALDLLGENQQLVIDLGSLLEQVRGEDAEIVSLLEQYCEELYKFYQLLAQSAGREIEEKLAKVERQRDIMYWYNRLDESCEAVFTGLEEKILKRRTVLFLPVLSKDWAGLQSMWQDAKEEPLCDVYVVPLPYYYKDFDGSPRKVCCEIADYPEEVNAQDYKFLTTEYLEMLHPEIIVIQNPYDSWNPAISVPEMFYSENIRKYTDKLVYVPPFVLEEYTREHEREYYNMKHYVTMPGVVYADCVIVQSENMKQMYISKLAEYAGEETVKIWEQRVIVCHTNYMRRERKNMRMDDESGVKKNIYIGKKVLYGISIGAYREDVQVAYDKIQRSLYLFEKAGIDVTMQIFPNSEATDDIRKMLKTFLLRYQNVHLDELSECAVEEYDAYFGDVIPLVMKFCERGKPTMIQDIFL